MNERTSRTKERTNGKILSVRVCAGWDFPDSDSFGVTFRIMGVIVVNLGDLLSLMKTNLNHFPLGLILVLVVTRYPYDFLRLL